MGERTLQVFGKKNFTVKVPEGCLISYGPWSPPPRGKAWQDEEKRGTLRIYHGKKDNIIALFTDVISFYDVALEVTGVGSVVPVKEDEQPKKRKLNKLKKYLEELDNESGEEEGEDNEE